MVAVVAHSPNSLLFPYHDVLSHQSQYIRALPGHRLMSSGDNVRLALASTTNISNSIQASTPSTSRTTESGSSLSLKRMASHEPDGEPAARKRIKECIEENNVSMVEEATMSITPHIDGQSLADDLAQELQCGCCSELVYKPVVVAPCEHFFCGRSVDFILRDKAFSNLYIIAAAPYG